MLPFELNLPTRLVFGEGVISGLTAAVEQFGSNVLLVTGGGSVRRMGLLDKVKALLPRCRLSELSGIAPNPKIDSVRRGVAICRDEKIDVIVALGGGSVIDAAKAVAAGACFEGDVWDLVKKKASVIRALPVVAVLTLAATGSEYDGCTVISNPETKEKLSLKSPLLFPAMSFCDPAYTVTVPAGQTAAGACDILSHVFEQYFVAEGNDLTDSLSEALMRTVIKFTPIALAHPENLKARGELMAASSFGCCGLLAMGRTGSPWPCHGIEHELSAFYDITHGTGLAIITPHWMRWTLTDATAPRFAQYGVRVWGLSADGDAMTTARKAVDLTADFFGSIGMPATLTEVGITDEHFEAMADHLAAIRRPMEKSFRPMDRDGILAVLRAAL